MNITALILDVCFAVTVCWMVYKSYRRGFCRQPSTRWVF